MKNFNKNLIVYGVIPVVSKASGFILLPYYIKYFNSEAFGYMELFLTLFSFATLLVNLEIYTSIGRYFFDFQTVDLKKRLISTGLNLTIIFSIMIGFLLFFFDDYILTHYIRNINHSSFYTIGVFYVIFNAYSTYLSVVPRYDNKAKLFTIINSFSVIIKLSSILFCLIYLELGLISVIIGHLVQVVFSSIFYTLICRKFLGFIFDFTMIKKIMAYALPLLPFVFLIGLWEPLSRYFLSSYFTKSEIGLLNFCLRLASIIELLNSAIQMTWMPMLYKNKDDINFKSDTVKLTHKVSMVLLITISMISLLSPEIITLLNATDFINTIYIINFVFLFNYFKIMVRLRGYLPYINNKTYMLSIAQVISFVFAIPFIFIVKNSFGIIGLVAFLLIPYFLNYIILSIYTEIREKVKFHNSKEIIMFLFTLSIGFLHFVNDDFYFRYSILIFLLLYSIYNFEITTKFKNWYGKR